MSEPTAAPLPLAELHCHLEGTITPVLAHKIGARYGVDLSSILDENGDYRWSTFADFIHVYDTMSGILRAPQDYYDVAYAYLTDNAADGLIYSEIFISPEHAVRFGVSYSAMVEAIAQAIDEAEAKTGVVGRMILTCVRNFGVEHAEKTARLAEDFPHARVTGFGIAGDEALGSHADFARAFEIARNGAGLSITAHAGELLGADSVRTALDAFDPARIGHGVRAIEDPALVAELAERGVTLELCPSSNVAIGLYGSLDEHPIARLTASGVATTLSTDDPAFFFTTIAQEYARIGEAHGLSEADLLGFTRRSIDAAFCDPETKERLYGRLQG
ncbi:MAG: adenosine deaminase [Pseudomonadota bacterium]